MIDPLSDRHNFYIIIVHRRIIVVSTLFPPHHISLVSISIYSLFFFSTSFTNHVNHHSTCQQMILVLSFEDIFSHSSFLSLALFVLNGIRGIYDIGVSISEKLLKSNSSVSHHQMIVMSWKSYRKETRTMTFCFANF